MTVRRADVRVATIPREHTVQSLLGVLNWIREAPGRTVIVRGFPSETYDREGFEAWFHDRLNEKINRNLPTRGRKDCDDWFHQACNTAREVNTPRLIVRWVPFEFRSRLAHRIERELT